MKVDWNLLISQNAKSFLTSSRNNQQLIDLLTQKLFIDGIHVKKATGNPDMLIVKEALVKTEQSDSVVVHSRDTDIFIALLHHLDSNTHKNVTMKTKKGEKAEQLSSEMQGSLPFAPAISGCDTVSATYGLGKLRAYKKSMNQTLGEISCVSLVMQMWIESMIEMGEKFHIELYGKLGKKADSFDHLR